MILYSGGGTQLRTSNIKCAIKEKKWERPEKEQMMIKIFSTKEVDSIVSRAQRLLLLLLLFLLRGVVVVIIIIER